jgi:hypothetical protein
VEKGRIGVWFSVALGILVLSFWPGRILGIRAARYWYQHQERRLGTLDASQRPHLESVLAELTTVEELRVVSDALSAVDAKSQKKRWPRYIHGLNSLKQKSITQEGRSVIDLELGIAYVMAATVEEQDNNKEVAAQYMESARSVLQSLGWQGYSDDALTSAAKHESDRREPAALKKGKELR